MKDKFDAVERFWIGPRNPTEHVVWHMQRDGAQFLMAEDGTILDRDYSEFSVRLHDPRTRSLSFINRTIAIIPKSRLRTVHRLIGEYLNEVDK
jgi:hypothetical protein